MDIPVLYVLGGVGFSIAIGFFLFFEGRMLGYEEGQREGLRKARDYMYDNCPLPKGDDDAH